MKKSTLWMLFIASALTACNSSTNQPAETSETEITIPETSESTEPSNVSEQTETSTSMPESNANTSTEAKPTQKPVEAIADKKEAAAQSTVTLTDEAPVAVEKPKKAVDAVVAD